eukprot:g19769.t1
MVDRPTNHAVDFFGQDEENTISYGLLRSAVEMGEAVTEAGAVSAAAAFFRQNLNACAWVEEPTLPPFGTTATSLGAPPLLKFPLLSKCFRPAVTAVHGNDSDVVNACPASSRGEGGGTTEPLELVISRGPGPAFSEHEVRVARYAALLLSQALARIRDLADLSEARSALEDSLRGMREASDAVAVLVEERERRSRLEAQQAAGLEDRRKEEVSAAESALERARREAERLRGRLDAAGESLTAIAEAAGDVCRAVAAACDPCDDAADSEEAADLADDEARGEVVAVVERAARDALRCSSARVADGEKRVDGLPESARVNHGGRFAGDDGGGLRSSARHNSSDDEETDAAGQLHVPIPYHDSATGPLVLAIHGVPNPRQRSASGSDRTAASALAACLGTALLALSKNREKRRVLRQVEADRQAAAVLATAAEDEAQERGHRAVASMRSLVAAAHLSRVQAEAAASAARRAERHADALGHLLSGLDGARSDHAAVARVVYCQAGAAVPGCVGAVLLTPRWGGGKGGSTSSSFSPDPRAWATATAQKQGYALHGSENNGRGSKSYGRQWAKRVERAAVQAVTTGKAVCVDSSGDGADVSGGGGAGAGVGDGEFDRSRVVCFSPVPGAPSPGQEGQANSKTSDKRPFDSSAFWACSDRKRTADLQLQWEGMTPNSAQTRCLIAWMISLGADEEIHDPGNKEENSGGPWAADSPLTDENVSSIPAVAETPPPRPPPPPPPLLPSRVSAAIEAVVHAVDLALCSPTPTPTAADAPTHRQLERSNAPPAGRGRGQTPGRNNGFPDAAEDAASEELEKSRRDEELRRLRDGTAALADRVRTLEGRAAGLRASEARSAAALAKAQADAGAVRGELQLAAFKLERARREPLVARSVGNSSQPRGRHRGAGWSGAFRPFGTSSRGTVGIIGSRFCGQACTSSSSSSNSGGGGNCTGGGGGSGVRAATVPVEASSRGEGEEAVQRSLPSRTALASTALPGSSPSLPLPPGDVAVASSAALQHMASVHARLSSSLKSSRLSETTAGPEGTAPALLGGGVAERAGAHV